MANINFVGLGNMGLPMVLNLIKAGHDVTGFDVVPAAQAAARAAGVTVVDGNADPAAAAAALKKAEIVTTMLPNGKLVLDVYKQLLPGAAPGTLFIDSSTIDVASARAAAEQAAAAGMAWSAAQRKPSPAPSRCWNSWAKKSSIVVRPAPVRPPKSATT
jgi:3-hydroxyisobutyrate dehydrogenase